MRIPVITINGSEPIDVTATIENGTKEYLSGKTVTGTALYVEQPDANGQGFLAMSLLIPKSGEMTLLKNNGFSENSVQWIIGKLSMLQEEIVEYVNEKVYDTPDAEDPVLVTHCIGLAGCLEYLHKNHGASWGTWTVAVADSHKSPAERISIARVTGTKAKVKEYLLKLASDDLAKSNRKGLTEEEWNKRLELYGISADKICESSDKGLSLVSSYEDKYSVTYAAAPETEAIAL